MIYAGLRPLAIDFPELSGFLVYGTPFRALDCCPACVVAQGGTIDAAVAVAVSGDRYSSGMAHRIRDGAVLSALAGGASSGENPARNRPPSRPGPADRVSAHERACAPFDDDRPGSRAALDRRAARHSRASPDVAACAVRPQAHAARASEPRQASPGVSCLGGARQAHAGRTPSGHARRCN